MSSDKKVVKIIRKSNDLVEGKYNFNMWETRVFTKMLTLISKDDEDFKEYRIFLKDVVKDFELKDKNAYAWIKKGAEGLAKKEIRVIRQTPEGEKEFLTHIAIGVESFTKNGNYVDISFHPKMKPFLLQLQTQFLMYDVENIVHLQSFYSIRIYELLKQYERIGKRTISIKELKEMLGIEDKYPQYGHLKSRIILKAQEDLASTTDISFDFEEIKEGRHIYALTFYIRSNKQLIKLLPPIEPVVTLLPSQPLETVEQLFEKIRPFSGATPQTLNRWIETYGKNHVETRINFVKNELSKGIDIKNPMGYLQTLMKQENFVNPEAEQSKLKQLEKELRLRRQYDKEVQEKIDNQKKQLFDVYRTKLLEKIRTFLQEDSELGNVFLEHLKSLEYKPINVQLALENYKRILTVKEGNAEEILYNFEAGGSFSFAFEEWICEQNNSCKELQDNYFEQLKELTL